MLDRYTRPEIVNQQADEQSRFNLSQDLKRDIGMKARHQNLDKILVREEPEEEEDPLFYMPNMTPEEAQMLHAARRLGLKKIKMGDRAFFTKQSMADVMKNNSVSAPFNPVAKDHFSNQNQAPDAAPPGQFFFDNIKNNTVNGIPQGYNDYENRQGVQAGQFTNSTPQQQVEDSQPGSAQWVPNANTAPAPIPEVKMNDTGKMGGEVKFKDPYQGISQMKKQSAPLFYDPRMMGHEEVMYDHNQMNTLQPQTRRSGNAVYDGPVGEGEWIEPRSPQDELSGIRGQLQQMGSVDDLSPVDRIKYQRLKGDYNRKQKEVLRQQNGGGVQYSSHNQAQMTPRQQAYDRMNEARSDMNRPGQSVGQERSGFGRYRNAAADYAAQVPLNMNARVGRLEGEQRADAVPYMQNAINAYDQGSASTPSRATQNLVNRQDYASGSQMVTQDPGQRVRPTVMPWFLDTSDLNNPGPPPVATGGELAGAPPAVKPAPNPVDEWDEGPATAAPVKMMRPGDQGPDIGTPLLTSNNRMAGYHYNNPEKPITRNTVRQVRYRTSPAVKSKVSAAQASDDGAKVSTGVMAPASDDGAKVSTGVMAPEPQAPQAPQKKQPDFTKIEKTIGSNTRIGGPKFGGRYA